MKKLNIEEAEEAVPLRLVKMPKKVGRGTRRRRGVNRKLASKRLEETAASIGLSILFLGFIVFILSRFVDYFYSDNRGPLVMINEIVEEDEDEKVEEEMAPRAASKPTSPSVTHASVPIVTADTVSDIVIETPELSSEMPALEFGEQEAFGESGKGFNVAITTGFAANGADGEGVGEGESLKEQVRKAGGKVDGYGRFSLAWNNWDDLDLHFMGPRIHVFYSEKSCRRTGARLDIDMHADTRRLSKGPIENIFIPKSLKPGTYTIQVLNYKRRQKSDTGWKLEAELGGKVYTFTSSSSPDNGPKIRFRVARDRAVEFLK